MDIVDWGGGDHIAISSVTRTGRPGGGRVRCSTWLPFPKQSSHQEEEHTTKGERRLTRAELWKVLADWIKELRDRFNLRTIDDLLGKVKELQKQST